MEYDEAKEYLQQLHTLRVSIRQKQEEMIRLRAEAETIVKELQLDSVQSMPDQDPLATIFANIDEIRRSAMDDLDSLVDVWKEVNESIGEVEDPKLRSCLVFRYVLGYNLAHTGKAMGVSYATVKRYHQLALEAL